MGKMRIMIVDDEEDFLKITKLNLEETGKFEVMTLPNAKDIISHLYNFKPHLILLDMLMPGVGGIEVCDMLNKDPVGQGVPIVVLSVLDKDSDKLSAFKKGVVDYLAKPIEKKVLVTKIERVLELKYGRL